MIYVFKQGSQHKNSHYDRFNEGRKIAVNVCDCEISRMRCVYWYALLTLALGLT
jgi:hypothetical protein